MDVIQQVKHLNSYNIEPVYYCKHCLSLHVISDVCDYCANCGNTDIDSTDIFNWEKLYQKKYGKKLIEL